MNNAHEFLDRLLLFGDVIDPLALFPLDEECLCTLLAVVEAGEDDEFEETDELAEEPLDVGTDVEFVLLPLVLLGGLNTPGVDLLLDGVEEAGGCDGRAWGYPGKACLSLP